MFNRVSFSEKMFFTKHLTVMLKGGIPIVDILEALIVQAKSGAFQKILQQAHDDVLKGQSLEKAFAKHPKVFDLFYISLVRVGEESGTLEESLAYLTEQLEKEHDLRGKVQSAMLYPSLILAVTGMVGLVLAFFVLPQIVELFENLDVSLPPTTKLLIFVSKALRDYGFIIVPGLFFSSAAMGLILRSRWIKPYRDAVLLKLPILGHFFKCVTMATLGRNLGIMLRAGLPVTAALATAAASEGNAVYKRDLEAIATEVKKGKSIEKAILAGKYREFPPFVSKMIGVGEKSGNLEENLVYLGEYFEAEVDRITKNLTTILEPALLFFIGGVVGFVALSIIAPIYQITGSIR